MNFAKHYCACHAVMLLYFVSFQKMDLGPCNKLHAAALKADFELASKKRDYGYDIDVSVKNKVLSDNSSKTDCFSMYHLNAAEAHAKSS